jgi:hypothetical protein
MAEDLWPEKLESEKIKPPVAILKEQASALAKKTRNLVEGKVYSEEGETLSYSFNLVAPALNNYRYRLFQMRHDIRMYPLYLNVELEIFKEIAETEYLKQQKLYDRGLLEPPDLTVRDEGQYISLLRAIFNANKTKQLISAMLAQSST